MNTRRVQFATFGVAFILLVSSACGTTLTPTATTEPSPELPGDREIVLASMQGEVSVWNVVSQEEIEAKAGQALMLGDTIMVGDGAAVLELDDGTQVFLGSYAMLTLTQMEGTLEKPHTRFFQWMGDAYHVLDEFPQGGSYEIEMVGLTANGQSGTWQSSAVFPVASVVQTNPPETQASAPDDDGDGIPNDLDACPTESGPAWGPDGCPVDFPVDSDGDNVIDSEDACPMDFGAGPDGCRITGDADGDGVANEEDGCPYEEGQADEGGCLPTGDLDNDGVPDNVDRCPLSNEPAGQDGCSASSDTDTDGLNDAEDACPYLYGTVDKQGCPVPGDADGDTVPDEDDHCPTLSGPAANSGCPLQEPDADSDGIPDGLDDCPITYGLPEYSGCPLAPDFDQDGFPDDEDRCPSIAAPESEDGCLPAGDMDGDGIPDSEDLCPWFFGSAAASGCPFPLMGPYTPTPTQTIVFQRATVEWLVREAPTETPTSTFTPTFTPIPNQDSHAGAPMGPACLCQALTSTPQYQAFLLLQQLMQFNQDAVNGVIHNMQSPVPAWDIGARLPDFLPSGAAGCSGGFASSVVNLDGQVGVSLTQPDGSQSGDIPLEPNNMLIIGGASPADPTTTVTAIMNVSQGQANASLQQMMLLNSILGVGVLALPIQPLPPTDVIQMPHVTLTVTQNSNCRGGPGLMYPVIASYPAGTQLLILGTSDAFGALWWKVQMWDENVVCWIAGTLVDSPISEDAVPQVPPPPTPTPRPQQDGGGGGLVCDQFATTEEECGAGVWNCSTTPCECSCDNLCPTFTSESTCNAHWTWYCSWTGSACVAP